MLLFLTFIALFQLAKEQKQIAESADRHPEREKKKITANS